MSAVNNALFRLGRSVSEFKPDGKLLGSVAADGIGGGYRLYASQCREYQRVDWPVGTFGFYMSQGNLFKICGVISLGDDDQWRAFVDGKLVGKCEQPADAIYALIDACGIKREP